VRHDADVAYLGERVCGGHGQFLPFGGSRPQTPLAGLGGPLGPLSAPSTLRDCRGPKPASVPKASGPRPIRSHRAGRCRHRPRSIDYQR
jgi:hypothetical protein